MRVISITRFGGPEGPDVVDVPEPEADAGQTLLGISAAGVNHADTQHALSSH